MLATRPTNATVVFQISECIAVIASISWTTRRPRSTINWHRFPKRVSWNKISFHWSISFPSVLTVLLSLCRASLPRNRRQTRPARFLCSLKHECLAVAGEDHQPVRKDVAPLCCCPLQKRKTHPTNTGRLCGAAEDAQAQPRQFRDRRFWVGHRSRSAIGFDQNIATAPPNEAMRQSDGPTGSPNRVQNRLSRVFRPKGTRRRTIP